MMALWWSKYSHLISESLIALILGASYTLPSITLFEIHASTHFDMNILVYIIGIQGMFLAIGSLLWRHFEKTYLKLLEVDREEIFLDRRTVITMALLILAACQFAEPHVASLYGVVILIAMSGVLIGALLLGSRRHSAVTSSDEGRLSSLPEALFGFGCTLTAMGVRPLLTIAADPDTGDIQSQQPQDQKIKYAHYLLASLTLLAAFLYFCVTPLYMSDNYEVDSPQSQNLEEPTRIRWIIWFMHVFYFVLETVSGLFLTIYCVEFLRFTIENAVSVTGVYYAAFTSRRATKGYIKKALKVEVVVALDMCFIIVGVVCFYLSHRLSYMAYVAVILTGVGVSSLQNSIFSYMSAKMKVTDETVFLIILSKIAGEALVLGGSRLILATKYAFTGIMCICTLGLSVTLMLMRGKLIEAEGTRRDQLPRTVFHHSVTDSAEERPSEKRSGEDESVRRRKKM